MPASTPHLEPGNEFETVFSSNSKTDSRYRFRATRMDGRRAPKVVLCNDGRIQVGQPCRVRVAKISKAPASDHGYIAVEWLGPVRFKLDPDFWIDDTLRLKLQALLECGTNILLDGPQGCGKTVLSMKVAEALGLEYVFFNCSAIFDPWDSLATVQMRAAGPNQVIPEWVSTPILEALLAAHENPDLRILIFLDEFNRCREKARNGIMPALDATRSMYNPITGSMIGIPDNVLWIAAVNNGDQFTGAFGVDPAQLDRFAPLRMEYMPPEEERRILEGRFPKAPKAAIERLVGVADAIRRDETLRLDLSVRATEEVCRLLEHPNFARFDGDPLPELLRTSFCGRFPGHWKDRGSDAGLVWQAVVRSLGI